jgi:drug/metabolite transporter (DMT)-like permease
LPENAHGKGIFELFPRLCQGFTLWFFESLLMTAERFSPRTIGIAAAVTTIAIWTSFIVIGRFMSARTLLPMDIVFTRMLGAALVLVPWGWWMVRRMRLDNPQAHTWAGLSPMGWRITALVGLLAGIGYPVLAYHAFALAPAAHGAVLMPGTLPLSTALLSIIVLGERLSRGRALGLAMILCGGLLVGGASLLSAFDGGNVWKGDVLYVTASSVWAAYTMTCRKYALTAVPTTIALIVFTALTFVPAYALLVASGAVTSTLAVAPHWEIAFQIIVQGMGSVVISGITFTKMVSYFGPVRSTMLTAVVPGLAALGAVLFLNEVLTWNLLAGLLLVTAGIVVGVRAAARGSK